MVSVCPKVGEHRLSAEFFPEDATSFCPASVWVVQRVIRRVPVLKWDLRTPTVTLGARLSASDHFTARCVDPEAISGRFSYSHSEDHALPVGTHTLRALVTPDDLTRYEPAEITADLTVLKIVPQLRWQKPAAVTYGTALTQLQLRAQPVDVPGSVEYDPAPGTVLRGGQHVLRARLLPFDSERYSPGEACVTLTVLPITPKIRWANQSSLPFGQPLTAAQLNAQLENPSIRGKFVYTPGQGCHPSILRVGQRTLSVEFIPDEPDNYLPATSSVSIEITKVKPVLLWDKKVRVLRYGTPLNVTEHLNACYQDPSITADFAYDKRVGQVLDSGPSRISLIARPHDSSTYFPDHKVRATHITHIKSYF